MNHRKKSITKVCVNQFIDNCIKFKAANLSYFVHDMTDSVHYKHQLIWNTSERCYENMCMIDTRG